MANRGCCVASIRKRPRKDGTIGYAVLCTMNGRQSSLADSFIGGTSDQFTGSGQGVKRKALDGVLSELMPIKTSLSPLSG